MDVSELCINEDAADSATSSEPSFDSSNKASNTTVPYIIESPPQNSGSSSSRNDFSMIENITSSQSVIYQLNPQLAYQQRYLQQHKNLKSYSISQRNHEDHSYYQQNQQQQPQRTEEHHLPRPNPLPVSATPAQSTVPPNNIHNTNISTLPLISSPYSSVEELNNNNTMLSQLLEQCSMVHSRIGKYRVDPLTESERSHIIDQVYFTAENMMRAIRQLHINGLQRVQQEQQRRETDDHTLDMEDSANNPSHAISVSNLDDHDDNINMNDQSDEYKMIRQARNLQDSNSRPKYRRRSKRSMQGMRCHSCGTSSTPEWRRGPDGARTLCNACGLHYSKLIRKGSMTVQTHNYLLESSPEFKRSPRVIKFPIIHVNTTTLSATTATTASVSTSASSSPIMKSTSSASISSLNRTGNNNQHRIVEIHPGGDSYHHDNNSKIYYHDEEMNCTSNDDTG